MRAQAVNLAEKLKLFDDHWAPRVVGSFNGHDLILVKVKGRFAWHSRPETDDFFSSSRAVSRSRCATAP
jgi:hypothetical protein